MELEKRLEHEARMSAAEDVSNDLLEEMIGEALEKVAKEEMRVVERHKKLQKYFKVTKERNFLKLFLDHTQYLSI